LALLLVGTATAFYVRSKYTSEKSGSLNDPLIDNDALEMGVLASAKPVSSQPSPGLPPKSGSVRKIDTRGANFPSPRIASSEAESYGVISTATIVKEEIIPQDSEADESGTAADSGGSVLAAAAAVTSAAKVCKVLVVGELRANMASIEHALKQAENEIREKYTTENNVQMEVTLKAFGPAEMCDIDQHLSKKLSQFHGN
jgi:hypothetical protein